MVKSPIVRDFIKSLQEAEEHCDPTKLVKLFDKSAELHNMTRPTAHYGAAKQHACSPAEFFGQYLSAFDFVSSHIINVIEDSDSAILEWHSEGQLKTGLSVKYSGASIIEHDGEKIKAFRTYYDSAALIPNVSTKQKSFSETVGLPEITNQATS